jgi:hypothetical protein
MKSEPGEWTVGGRCISILRKWPKRLFGPPTAEQKKGKKMK